MRPRSLSFSIFVVAQLFSFHVNADHAYNTINGQEVTVENFCEVMQQVSDDLQERVVRWFCKNGLDKTLQALETAPLVEARNFHIVGKKVLFQTDAAPIKTLYNFVFTIPDAPGFLVKVCAPFNKMSASTASYGLSLANEYTRMHADEKREDGRWNVSYTYTDFCEDKERMREYFHLCLPKEELERMATKKDIEALVLMVSRALPRSIAFLYNEIARRLQEVKPEAQEKTIAEVFEIFLDETFELISAWCWNKQDLLDKTVVPTFFGASRVFCMKRFNEAIELFNLYRLHKAPDCYLIQMNTACSSCKDGDVVYVEEYLEGWVSLRDYLKEHAVDDILDGETLEHFVRAAEYCGLSDFNKNDFLIDPETGKVTYVDFEHMRDTQPDELFNADDEHRLKSFCLFFQCFIKQLPKDSQARVIAVELARKDKDLPNAQNYHELQSLFEASNTEEPVVEPCPSGNTLGKLLAFDNPQDDEFSGLREAVTQEMKGCNV